VKDAKERIILIEVQFSRELDFMQRILYAGAKVITEHLASGKIYAEVSKVISINILHFAAGKGDDYIYHGTTRFISLHNHSELELSEQQKQLYGVQKIADLHPEYYLIELRNFNDVAKEPLDELIYFLKNEEIKENFTAKGLIQAKEALDVLKMTHQERLAYEQHEDDLHYQASMFHSNYILGKIEGKAEGREEGREEGLALGEAQGSKKGLLEAARKMQHAGMTAAHIAEITGLSLNEIETL